MPNGLVHFHIQIYLRCYQERGLMHKSRRLMDENSVSFQMFLILLSFITLGSENQISVFKQCQSNTLNNCFLFLFWGGEGGVARACAEAKIWSEEINLTRHFAQFNFSRLSLAFILKYYPILHVVKR